MGNKLKNVRVAKRVTTLSYVLDAIASFDNNPPDSSYLRGYLQALKDVRDKN